MRRGNEQSEAIGAGAPRQIPITRSKREVVPLGATSLFLYRWESNKECFLTVKILTAKFHHKLLKMVLIYAKIILNLGNFCHKEKETRFLRKWTF